MAQTAICLALLLQWRLAAAFHCLHTIELGVLFMIVRHCTFCGVTEPLPSTMSFIFVSFFHGLRVLEKGAVITGGSLANTDVVTLYQEKCYFLFVSFILVFTFNSLMPTFLLSPFYVPSFPFPSPLFCLFTY